jgi:hypothetical protein
MSELELKFTSRYDVFGPPNGCKGQCEGTGFIPHSEPCEANAKQSVRAAVTQDEPPIYRVLWYLAEAKAATDDGWHFIPCPDCRVDDPLMKLARSFMGA